MTRVLNAGLIALIVALGPSLSAQWPEFKVSGVPRTADGKPDLSGIWENFRKPDQTVKSVNAAFFNEPVPTLINEFRDIGASMKDGLPLQPWAAELKKQRMSTNSMDNPDAHCLPLGNMQLHTHVDPRRIVQTPSLVVFLYEANYGVRQIYVDGRPAPNNDPQPWWFGYSRGWYEGNDTLVVETTNFYGDERAGWLDVNGSPYSDALKMTERFRRPNFGTLEIDITIDDPKAYTKPFTVRVNQRLMVDQEMIEFICNENEQSTDHIPRPGQAGLPAGPAPAQ